MIPALALTLVLPFLPARALDGEPAAALTVEQAVGRALEVLLERQEGPTRAEWPYEGVYRVRGGIPLGYRVGGTAIVAHALLAAPGYAQDDVRREALRRALGFIFQALDDPLMDPAYEGGYDVRIWGHAYALILLLELETRGAFPEGQEELAAAALARCLAALAATEIPQEGGWSYSRAPSLAAPSPPSAFMTAPIVMALIDAAAKGHAVDPGLISRALDSLERGRTPAGGVTYAVRDGRPRGGIDSVPGAVGRMAATEAALMMGGRSDPARLRGAVDAFFVHWEHLEARRKQTGTHTGPFGIAPYYFYYAHYYAARAIELLPREERAEYRRRLHERIFTTRDGDGSWNDRVFPRSSAYGTAMVVLSLVLG
jgi:hypothetical protein